MGQADELKKLNELLEEGVLTQLEFNLKKREILSTNYTVSESAPQPSIVINNSNANVNTNTNINKGAGSGKPKNKWVALALCVFTVIGHKIYEGKIGMAILYFFTAGFCGIGLVVDIITLLLKPNPYYV